MCHGTCHALKESFYLTPTLLLSIRVWTTLKQCRLVNFFSRREERESKEGGLKKLSVESHWKSSFLLGGTQAKQSAKLYINTLKQKLRVAQVFRYLQLWSNRLSAVSV